MSNHINYLIYISELRITCIQNQRNSLSIYNKDQNFKKKKQ